MNKLSLPSGITYFINDAGQKVCTGSQMGRDSLLPDNPNAPIKLRMERLKWVDGDYDQWGAYWGGGNGDYVFCAWAESDSKVMVFVRSATRKGAKKGVREMLPKARFFR